MQIQNGEKNGICAVSFFALIYSIIYFLVFFVKTGCISAVGFLIYFILDHINSYINFCDDLSQKMLFLLPIFP